MEQRSTSVFVILLLCCGMNDVLGMCTFPDYLSGRLPDGSERTWVTETQYLEQSDAWDSQYEITVENEGMHIVSKIKFDSQCDYRGEGVPCFRRQKAWTKACMQDVGEGKYLVRSKVDGKETYSCLQLIQRNKNIVQVWESKPGEYKPEDLCLPHKLIRNEWPWIASKQEEWTACPFSGGFDFSLTTQFDHKRMCADVWRPSRMESECIMGEGLNFLFPDPACSPFLKQETDMRLWCWGHWNEDASYMYVLAGQQGQLPRYMLRLPAHFNPERGFQAIMYFSPIAPDSKKGYPLTRASVNALEMNIKRSEPGICYDESPDCQEYARQGKCGNSALYQYANYCKRSCGLCNLLPTRRPECAFPANYRGDWMLFERGRMERVTINDGHLTFSGLGEFVCKGKHWDKSHYKMLSYYSNGCRPRYTCMHFAETEDNILEYQMSRSIHSDESFSICQFYDDPPPLNDTVRSANLKILIPMSHINFDTCGLQGTIHVTDLGSNGQSCHGTLTDWDRYRCSSRSLLKMSIHGKCNDHTPQQQSFNDYECAAYVNFQDGFNLLITRTNQSAFSHYYTCWVIKTYPERMAYKAWEEIYQLDRAQCGRQADLDRATLSHSPLALKTHTADVKQKCDYLFPEKPSPVTVIPSSSLASQEDQIQREAASRMRINDNFLESSAAAKTSAAATITTVLSIYYSGDILWTVFSTVHRKFM